MITLEQKLYNWYLKTPDNIALVDNKNTVNYKTLFESIFSIKIYLKNIHGISKGDNVILSANKTISFIYSYFAIHLLAAKVVPIDEQISDKILNYIIKKTKPKLLVGIDNKINNINTIPFEVFENIKIIKPSNINFPTNNIAADILFTTGTSGDPKGVVLTNKNITQSTININSFLRNNNSDSELLLMPFSHSFGLARLRCILFGGGKVVLINGIANLKRMFRMLYDFNITGFGIVPSAWNYIKKMTGDSLGNFSNQLRYIELGSAFMSLQEKKYIMRLLPKTRICMHYGLTEASRSTFLEFHEDKLYLNTVGKSSPNVKIGIFDNIGIKLPNNIEGEICIKGDHVSKKYLNLNINDYNFKGYFRTGDLGLFNDEGYLILKGRTLDQINVGGKKVSPIEVENKIIEFDNRLDVACVGVPDPNGVLGEVVKAFIVKVDFDVDFNKINNFLDKNLEKYKIPFEYEWITNIPRTSSGKIKRQKLK